MPRSETSTLSIRRAGSESSMRQSPVICMQICPWCGQASTTDYVHGQGRCAICRSPVDACCEGVQRDLGSSI